MIMLIDINNCYCSFERVFNPALIGKKVVVLSNNDGAVISRSQEAKDLGIKMGDPLFKIADVVKKHDVRVYSSNYVLYADMSSRVMQLISSIVPEIEEYSIDECFVDMSSYSTTLTEQLAVKIKSTLRAWLGIPVSIGIGKTKSLAKVANKLAKKESYGIKFLDTEANVVRALQDLRAEDLWGIGSRYTQKLAQLNVRTALEFRNLPEAWVRKNMTVETLRLKLELSGIKCRAAEMAGPAKRKAIGSAKSFGQPVTELPSLIEAATSYLSACALKAREQNSLVSIVSVFIQTNPFNATDPQYCNQVTTTLPVPTNVTPSLLKEVLRALTKIYKPGYRYKRVGILLSGLIDDTGVQENLFSPAPSVKTVKVQKVIDSLNSRFVRDKVRFACQGFDHRWTMKQQNLSKCFTTRASDLITAYCR